MLIVELVRSNNTALNFNLQNKIYRLHGTHTFILQSKSLNLFHTVKSIYKQTKNYGKNETNCKKVSNMSGFRFNRS